MDQPIRPKRNKSLPARLAAGECDLYDFHPSSDMLESVSVTPSCASNFRQANTNSIAPRAPLARLQTLQRQRAHIITFDRSTITRASCDPSIILPPSHQAPPPLKITRKEAHLGMSDKDSAVCVIKNTRRGKSKKTGRPNQGKITKARVQADRLSYLDPLLASSLLHEKRENAKHNLDTSWLYNPVHRPSSGSIRHSAHQDGDVIGKIRYIVRPPEPRYWERARYKQRWERTEAAKAFEVTYTEADDFSASGEDDEYDQTVSSTFTMHANVADKGPAIPPPPPIDFIDRLDLISLLDLPNTLARHILNTTLKDCITKYGVPGWLCQAQSILKLSPKELDWMEDTRLRCLGLQSSRATLDDVENTWLCYNTKRLHREERQTHLDQEPSKALAWLEEDYEDWFCTKGEVKTAILYLLQRGWTLKMAEELGFGEFLEVESDDESDGGDGDDEKGEGIGNDDEDDEKGGDLGNDDEDDEMGEVDDRGDGKKEDSAVFED